MNLRSTLAVAALLALSACTVTRPALPEPEIGSLDGLLAAHPMPADANIYPLLVSRSAASSRHLIRIRGREARHVHAEHDLVVFLVRGEGVLHIAGSKQAMTAGAIAVIDRGIPHWFENTGPEPAAAFVVFAPPYDGTDNLPVD